jgi:hypothetical protein
MKIAPSSRGFPHATRNKRVTKEKKYQDRGRENTRHKIGQRARR